MEWGALKGLTSRRMPQVASTADEEAESLYQRALQIREGQRGPHHPETGLTLADLARLRQQQDKLDEALTLAERALQILSPSLGDTHPKTVATRLLVAQLGETRGTSQDGASCPREAEEHPNDSSTAHRQEEAVLTPQEPSESFPSDHDPLQAFLTACCELHSHAWSRSAEIWQAYQHWTEEHHERYPLARGAFLAQLKRHGCRADRTTTARIWRGIGLLKNGL